MIPEVKNPYSSWEGEKCELYNSDGFCGTCDYKECKTEAFNTGVLADRKVVIEWLDQANDLKDLEKRFQELKKGFKGAI
jgi:hypothetical protein